MKLVVSIRTQCVNFCQQDFTRGSILIRKCASLYHGRTRSVELKTRGCNFSAWDLIVIWKTSTQRKNEENLFSLLMETDLIALPSFRLWVSFISWYDWGVRPPLTGKKYRVLKKGVVDELKRKDIEIKDLTVIEWRNVGSGDYIRKTIILSIVY